MLSLDEGSAGLCYLPENDAHTHRHCQTQAQPAKGATGTHSLIQQTSLREH